MKGKWTLLGSILAVLLLALAAGLTRAQGPEPPGEGVQPQGGISIAATVTSTISYQGVLKENGQPVTGSRDMTFRLYSDNTCTSQVGSDIVKSGVSVTNGLFSVELDVNPTHFNGQGLWLKVVVGSTELGCQEILPVPYALSLRPGARIQGSSASADLVTTEMGSGWPPPLYPVGVKGEGKWGVYGYSADAIGVYGKSASTSGIGVYGIAQATSGTTYGVYGRAQSPDGYGGYFENTASNGYGGYFAGGAGAIYADGDVVQTAASDGLVKAAVYAYCANAGSAISRSFNNVTGGTITISNGSTAGSCILNFGFDFSNRYWIANATGAQPHFVTCTPGAVGYLFCYRFDAAGNGVNGHIMVMLY